MSVIAIASMLATQAPITLLYQPKVGSTLKYSTSVSQSNPMAGGNSTTSMTTTMKVLSFSGGFYKVENSTTNYKSSAATNSKAAAQTKKMMEGRKTVMFFDKFGAMKMQGQGNQPKGMQEVMGALNGQGTGMLFPTKPVKVGETWGKTIDIGSLMGAATNGQGKGTGKLTMTYKLLKIEGANVVISATQKGSMNMTMGAGKAGAQPMTMSMTFNGSGSMSVDRATGTLVSGSNKVNMGVMGQQMTMSMTTKKI